MSALEYYTKPVQEEATTLPCMIRIAKKSKERLARPYSSLTNDFFWLLAEAGTDSQPCFCSFFWSYYTLASGLCSLFCRSAACCSDSPFLVSWGNKNMEFNFPSALPQNENRVTCGVDCDVLYKMKVILDLFCFYIIVVLR